MERCEALDADDVLLWLLDDLYSVDAVLLGEEWLGLSQGVEGDGVSKVVLESVLGDALVFAPNGEVGEHCLLSRGLFELGAGADVYLSFDEPHNAVDVLMVRLKKVQ